jgi:UDP-N-acetylglucosamine 2-epimerase (non-hydrolysing)
MTTKRIKSPLKLVLVAGARPNFMKVSPLIRAIRLYNRRRKSGRRVEYYLVHTGQHYDANMSAIFFKELGIPAPHINLEIGSGTHARQAARIMTAFEPVCLREKPDWVVVVGDVNSTMACTLVSSKLGIRVAHVEAGLRSFDRTMPEEINRVVTDALADLLLTPSSDANQNLIREGVPTAKIRFVGNIMIDTLVVSLKKAKHTRLPEQYGLQHKKFAYVTLHRPANVDDPRSLKLIVQELGKLASRLPVVFPVHPRTRYMLERFAISIEDSQNLLLLDPIGYHDSLWLTQNALFVLTDSGGLQEESTYFRTPCLTLRPNTERPITITIGTNKLTSHESLASDIEDILKGARPNGKIPRFWDGHAAERTLKLLLKV